MSYRTVYHNIFLLLVAVFGFLFSMHIFDYYVGGDQQHYIRFYGLISSVEFKEVRGIAYSHIDSSEPISLFIFWFGSHVLNLEKDIWISLINGMFIMLFYKFLHKNNTPAIPTILLMTNFYILVLLFSAERLKFAFLFMMISLIVSNRKKYYYFLASVLSHFQILMFVPVAFMYYYSREIKDIFYRLKVSRPMLYSFIGAIFLVILVIGINYDGFFHKIDAYIYREKDFSILLVALSKVTILFLIVAKNSKDKLRTTLVFLPFAFFSILLGGQRVVMMAFALFVYILALERGLNKPLPILVLTYFSAKSILFLNGVYNFGNGFEELYF